MNDLPIPHYKVGAVIHIRVRVRVKQARADSRFESASHRLPRVCFWHAGYAMLLVLPTGDGGRRHPRVRHAQGASVGRSVGQQVRKGDVLSCGVFSLLAVSSFAFVVRRGVVSNSVERGGSMFTIVFLAHRQNLDRGREDAEFFEDGKVGTVDVWEHNSERKNDMSSFFWVMRNKRNHGHRSHLVGTTSDSPSASVSRQRSQITAFAV